MRHEEALGRLPELLGVHPAGPDEARLRAHAAGCRACRERLEALRRVDELLATAGAPAAPPPALQRRVLAIPALQRPASPRRRRGVRGALAGLAAALVVLAAALAVLVAVGDDPVVGFTPTRTVALSAQRASGVAAAVELGSAQGERLPVRVVATGLAHGPGTFYGLWFTGPAGAVSGGSFRPDGAGRCVVLMQVPAGDWTTVAITAADRPPAARTTVAQAAL